MVEMGVKKSDKLYLSLPANAENFKYTGLELMEEINRKKAEEEQRRREMQEKMNQPQQPRNLQGMPGGGSRTRTRG